MEEENYMRMLAEAEEIQSSWHPEYGDKYTFPELFEKTSQRIWIYPNYEIEFKLKAVWLPTLEQLQEMIDWNKYSIDEKNALGKADVFISFLNWLKNSCGLTGDALKSYFTSLKELWLAFVMKDRYNKIWDGKKWKISDAKIE